MTDERPLRFQSISGGSWSKLTKNKLSFMQVTGIDDLPDIHNLCKKKEEKKKIEPYIFFGNV